MNDEKEKMRSNQLKNKLITNIKKEPDIDMIKRVRYSIIHLGRRN